MYNEFYNLKLPPFQISCDPAFMWFGEKHQEALATLKYGILDNKGFLLLTGDVGTGKTSLINALIQSLGQDIIYTAVPDPSLIKLDFFNYIAASFGIDREFTSKGAFLAHFKNFLLRASEKNKKVLLIIDEAQLLTQEMLEEIRLLSNIEKPNAKLINIFFIGQNEFNEILNRPQNRAVLQRMTLNFNLDPLTPEEVDAYIRHRLKVAGTQERLFDWDAVQEIFLYSGGFPRRINILCDHSLLSGFVREQRVIDAGIVKECAKELKIPAHVHNRDINDPFESGTRPKNKNESPGDLSNRAFDPYPPVQHPVPPVSPAPQPQNNLFSWDKLVTLILFFIFAWYFMFPDHFFSMRSQGTQPFDQRQELVEEQKPDQTLQPENKPVVRNIEHPETNPSPKLNNPPRLLPKDKITIRFKSNGDAIIEEDLRKLNAVSKSLIVHPNSKILITGYTDASENGTYNVKLSEFRATIVKSFLLGQGVKSYQMKIQGRGGQDPVEKNDTAWGRMMNRRVEIEVIE
ncbi:type II secretory pathway protein [Desulfobacter hydrogenophilus]|uniref:AAA family ATPase n=2 Tax=Desulfobacter hydrogenophilus TaxID=2291 RepID=A0A328FF77_9BACT|nr:AAA family ATPase [Desulfobacter hydrogenophilus]NDY72439.1 AAA family ATPase [Desulfobacter hydrogenophilus]QBH13761.1 AAA family ATPase [Desulfobacter hydrogenophilus]RAM01705.1 type II secretory pathway protein [Desulfobacter hydrogenophilus]